MPGTDVESEGGSAYENSWNEIWTTWTWFVTVQLDGNSPVIGSAAPGTIYETRSVGITVHQSVIADAAAASAAPSPPPPPPPSPDPCDAPGACDWPAGCD
jgi:hypothetical protein